MSGSRTVSGLRSKRTPVSDPTNRPSRLGLTNPPRMIPKFSTISPCSSPADMVSQNTPLISSPRTPSLCRRRRSSAVRSFGFCCIIVTTPSLQTHGPYAWGRLYAYVSGSSTITTMPKPSKTMVLTWAGSIIAPTKLALMRWAPEMVAPRRSARSKRVRSDM